MEAQTKCSNILYQYHAHAALENNSFREAIENSRETDYSSNFTADWKIKMYR